MARYTWRKLPDKSDYPPGLADLIREAHVLVEAGAEYAGVFVHDEGRCWLGYKSRTTGGDSSAQVFASPDDAVREAERLMDLGLLLPRRRARH